VNRKFNLKNRKFNLKNRKLLKEVKLYPIKLDDHSEGWCKAVRVAVGKLLESCRRANGTIGRQWFSMLSWYACHSERERERERERDKTITTLFKFRSMHATLTVAAYLGRMRDQRKNWRAPT